MKNGKVLAKLAQNPKVESITQIAGGMVDVLLTENFFHAEEGRKLRTCTAHAARLFIRDSKPVGEGNKVVKNIMTGKSVTIPTSTPRCCDPSSETYWSM